MNFSTILKGAAVAASFALVVSEASAQLPVRTRQLQLLGSTSGTLTHTAAAATTSHTLTWPAALPAATFDGVLRTDDAGTLTWYPIAPGDDIITGNGDNGEVAIFGAGNTLTSFPDFTFSGSNVTIGTGTNTGTLTLNDVGGGATVQINPGSQNGNVTATLDAPTGAGPHSVTIPVSTNAAGPTTTDYIAVSNGDGTFSWVESSTTNLQRGRIALTAGNFSQTVNFGTAYAAPVTPADIIVTANILSADANIIQITGITLTGFTVESTAPFGVADFIMWTSNVNP